MKRTNDAAETKIRTRTLAAVAWLIAAWSILLLAYVSGLWQLSVVSVLCATWGVSRDVVKEGYFHPVLVFSLFSVLVVLLDVGWMATRMYDTVPFFSYEFWVTPEAVLLLAREQLILFSAVYAGYLLVAGVRGKNRYKRPITKTTSFGSLWLPFYLIGLAALLALIISSGGFSNLVENLGAQYERAEGRGELVLLTGFALTGVLMWFEKNIFKPAWYRYSGLLVLIFPLLMSGARVWLLVAIISAMYMDERLGRRISIKKIALVAIPVVVFFALYQDFRGGQEIDILDSVYTDLAMGTGYVVAAEQGVFGDELRLNTLFLILAPFISGSISDLMNFTLPDSPNYVLSQFLFSGTSSTYSMGVMGEASYIAGQGGSFLYYLVTGLILAWIGSWSMGKSLLIGAVVAGGVVRIVKGGITQGGAYILMLLVPLLVAYLVAMVIIDLRKRRGMSKRSLQRKHPAK